MSSHDKIIHAFAEENRTVVVGITLYLILMTEFFLRFNLRKPLRSPPHSLTHSVSFVDSTQTDKAHTLQAVEANLAGETVMSQEIKLMVIGLVVTTLLILIRYVEQSAWSGRSVPCD